MQRGGKLEAQNSENQTNVTDYASLIEAIEAAQAGETITLTQEITSNEIIVINKAITLDGNGKTLTSTAARAINVSGADGVTIKNLIIECSGERAINVIQNATNVTIDNVTATASNYTVNVATSAGATKVSINGSILNGLCTVNVAGPGADVTITNSTVNCNDNNTTVGESYAAICLNKDATNGTITVTGSTITVTDGSDSMKARNSAEGGVITIDGSSEDVLTMVAIIDYPEYNVYHSFATLAGAIEFATEGQTVTLIRDIELTECVTVPADATITIDLNGKTISQTKAQTAGYQMILNDGNLTINDSSEDKTGKISYTDSGNGGEYISDVIYNRATLVINGGTIENLSSATVASNGYPHAVDTYSGIRNTSVTINGGTIYCAEYSAVRMFCVSTTYNADLVINGGTIKGAIDMQNGTKVSAIGTLTINGGTFETTKNVNNIRFANWNNGATEYGISAEIKNGSFNGGITTAYVPAAANWDKGIISGGTFTQDLSEYCAEGYAMEVNEDGTYGVVETTAVAQIGETKYGSLQDAENAAENGETIVLLKDIVLDGMVTFFNSASERMLILDMNGKTIELCDNWPNATAKSAFWVCDGLTITGNGTINANPNDENDPWAYAIIVGHRNTGTTEGYSGNLVIENGTFYGDDSSVISVTNGTATINGGTFESAGDMDLNCIDDMYAAGKANITVKGGTFKGFNPENNACEGDNTNFCAEGYAALPDLNGNYVVGAKPTATVNNLGRTEILGGDYSIWNGSYTQTQTGDPAMPLSFVMQFLADQNEEDMANSPYADWYGDFVITFTGIEKGSFLAEGCYLAGHYGSFGWVKIPVDEMTIEEGVRYPVMLGVGLGQNYDYICSSVEDFKCALYLTPEILEANPNIQVNLELAIVDNSQGENAAVSALVNNENVYSVTDYDYDAIDFNTEYVARIENVGYETLEAAVEAVETGETIEMTDNYELSSTITFPAGKTVTLDLNGKKITYNSTTQGEAMITNNGILTINDGNSAKESTGEIYYNYTGAADPTFSKGNYTISNGGTLTVNGGKIHIANISQHAKYPINNNSGTGDAILVINGGHLYNYNTSAIRQFCNSTTYQNSVTINGGLIEGYSAIWMQNPGNKEVNGQLTIAGGEIRTTAKAYVEGTAAISDVSSRIYCTIDGEGGSWNDGSAFVIKGGTINENVDLGGATPASVTLMKEAAYNGYIEFGLSEGSQLFHNGLQNVTINMNIAKIDGENGWYTIASPVGTVEHSNVDGLLTTDNSHDLYRYDESNYEWENVEVEVNNFTTLEAGRGYIYANTIDTELTFTGDLVTEAIEQTITAEGEKLTGFNLIGNPFTHNITLDHITGVELVEGFYTLTHEGAWNANNSNTGIIGACQGALVKTTNAGTISIVPKVTEQRGESEDNGSIKINVSNKNYNDVAYVSFIEGIGLDKIEHRNANIPMIYVPVNGKNYAVATMSKEVTEIPVSFEAKTMGEYTISVEAQDCEFATMTLIDRLTGVETNLLLEDYTFMAKSNDNTERFVIRLTIEGMNSTLDNFAYISNNELYISCSSDNALVEIYDVLGRPVASYDVNKSTNISTENFTNGIYIIRLVEENDVKVQKILID